MISCKNCGGFFTRAEVLRMRRPVHVWALTERGKAVLAENEASGEQQWPCPTCGHCTLRAANTSQPIA